MKQTLMPRISLLIDRDFQRLIPTILVQSPEYAEFRDVLSTYDWDKPFSLDIGDATLSWIKDEVLDPPFGTAGLQWNPREGEILDATCFILPGVDVKGEEKFLRHIGVENNVVKALGQRPQVYIQTQAKRLYRCPSKAKDGNNRMVSKERLIEFVYGTLGMFGMFALMYKWRIDIEA